MQITHLGHACLLIEVGQTRLLIDPGGFTPGFEEVRDLAGVVFTHRHPDHLDPKRVPDLVQANPDAAIIADPGSAEALGDLGIETSATLAQDDVQVGALTLTPVGNLHALIHEDIPVIPNVGVVVRAEGEPTLYHPGDFLDGEPGEVDIVAFPLNAPWQRSRDMIGFLRRIGAPTAIPIHDGLLGEVGRNLYLGQARDLGGSPESIRDLAGQGAVTFTA